MLIMKAIVSLLSEYLTIIFEDEDLNAECQLRTTER